jgi:hypothetical protein
MWIIYEYIRVCIEIPFRKCDVHFEMLRNDYNTDLNTNQLRNCDYRVMCDCVTACLRDCVTA